MRRKHYLVVVLLTGVLSTPIAAYPSTTVVCRDRNGNKTGSIQTAPEGTATFYDRIGNRVGTARKLAGKTLFYDRRGNKVGECIGNVQACTGCMGIRELMEEK